MAVPAQKRILELNPEHGIVSKLRQRHSADAEDPRIPDTAQILLGYALLAEGSELPDPAAFNRLVADLLEGSL